LGEERGRERGRMITKKKKEAHN